MELLIGLLVLLIVAVWWTKKPTNDRSPPTVSFLTAIKFFNEDPLDLMHDAIQKHGKLFTVNCGSFKTVVITTEEQMKIFYGTPKPPLGFIEGLATMQPLLYANDPLKLPFRMATRYKSNGVNLGPTFRHWAMHKSELEKHLLSARQEIEGEFEKICQSGKKVNMFEFFDHLVTYINIRMVVGTQARKQHGDEIARLVSILEKSAATPATIAFPYMILLPRVAKAFFARKKLFSILAEIYRNHPKNPDHESFAGELLSLFPPDALAEGEVFLTFEMLYVAHTNTASTMAWSLIHLSQHPELLEEIKRELGEVDIEAFMNDCGAGSEYALPATVRAMNETIRLTQGGLFCRVVVTDDFEMDGYHIPKDTLVTAYPRFFHYNSEFFSEPNKFEPKRFLDPNIQKAQSCDLFGGGLHMCLGRMVATAIVKLCYLILFSKYKINVHLPDGKPVPNWQYMSGMPLGGSKDAYITLTKR